MVAAEGVLAMKATPPQGRRPLGSAPARSQDPWATSEREGYSDAVTVAYAPVRQSSPPPQQRPWIRAEERLGSLIAGGGIVWTTQALTTHYQGLTRISILQPGPLEVCAVGILVWLHAKWRKSLRMD